MSFGGSEPSGSSASFTISVVSSPTRRFSSSDSFIAPESFSAFSSGLSSGWGLYFSRSSEMRVSSDCSPEVSDPVNPFTGS